MAIAIARRPKTEFSLTGFSRLDVTSAQVAAAAEGGVFKAARRVRAAWTGLFIGDPRIVAAADAASAQRMLAGRF